MARIVIGMALFCFLVLASAALAAGRVEGQVTQEDGSGVEGLTVEIEGLSKKALTSSDGRYQLSGVPAGTYTVRFVLGGETESSPGVEVSDNRTTTLNHLFNATFAYAQTIHVYSASRNAERIVEAEAAVTRVAAKEIEREASHGQLSKLLEFTPGQR